MDNLSAEELKKLKRDATIRAREDDYEKKRKLEEERKRQQLAELKEQYEQLEEKKLRDRLETLKKRAAARSQREAEIERLNRKREDKIAQREEAWRKRANEEIQQVIDEARKEEEKVELTLLEARERKREREEKVEVRKREEKARQYDLDIQRGEKIADKANKREVREIHRVDMLKTEAQQELQSFIQNPFPVPLKQVLAGRVRPVPKVTELLAAYKDQREALKDLEEQDIPMRALLRNQTLFQYVRDIQMTAESERMHPPEPVIGDTGRGAGRSKRGPGSPSGRSPARSPQARSSSPSRTGQGWRSASRPGRNTAR